MLKIKGYTSFDFKSYTGVGFHPLAHKARGRGIVVACVCP